MNVADYKSQLEQSFEPSTSYQWSLIDNNLTVRKFTSSDISFRLLVVQLEEVDLLKSLPDFMAAIAKSITQLSEDLREKENLVEKLSKRKLSYKTMSKKTKVTCSKKCREYKTDRKMQRICEDKRRYDSQLVYLLCRSIQPS